MKNKYLKGAHLSEKKVREILRLYCEDFTATQIAAATGVSRISINAYLKLFRHRIAAWTEEARPETIAIKTNNLAEPNGIDQPNNRERGLLFGLTKNNGYIFSFALSTEDKNLLTEWNRNRSNGHQAEVTERNLDLIEGFMDLKSGKLFRLRPGILSYSSREAQDEIDYFWVMMKSRMVKFRGLSQATIPLHVKETEFRFNNRNRDLYDLLIGIMQTKRSECRPSYT